MDKFVKGENEMWKMPPDGTHSNKNSLSISSEESAGLSASTFGLSPATHLKMFRQKETPIGYYAAIILNYRYVANHLWREPQIIKFENAFHIWINIGYICERTLSAVLRVKSRFRARLTDCNVNVLLLLSSRISQNWSAPDSIRCFINGE